MIVTSNSDIQEGNSRVYLNNTEQLTNLFFTSAKAKQYYFLMRDEEVISNGVLQGFLENSLFNYRYNFLHFIKIYNQEIPKKESLDSYGSYKFVGDNTCNLYLYIGDTDILQANITASKLIVKSDGRIYLNRAFHTYEDIERDHKVFVTFIDASFVSYDKNGYELQYRIETQPIALRGSYMPVTVYRNNSIQYEFKGIGGSIYKSPILKKGTDSANPGNNDGYILTQSDGYIWDEHSKYIKLEQGMTSISPMNGYVTYMIKIPNNAITVDLKVTTTQGETNYSYKAMDGCMTPYYFWNENGAYDSIYCSGVANKVLEVEKEYINLNGTQIPLKITSIDKIKHNTGLALKQEQIYSLVKSPVIHKVEDKIRAYNIDLESFEGYNGVNLSERNIELVFSKPRETRRATTKLLNFFD